MNNQFKQFSIKIFVCLTLLFAVQLSCAQPVTVDTDNLTVSPTWQNIAFTPQHGRFTVTFDTTPAANPVNLVMGLASSPAKNFRDMACIIRLNPTGQLDTRHGNAYAAANQITCSQSTR